MQQVLFNFNPKDGFRQIYLPHRLPLGVQDIHIHQRISACA